MRLKRFLSFSVSSSPLQDSYFQSEAGFFLEPRQKTKRMFGYSSGETPALSEPSARHRASSAGFAFAAWPLAGPADHNARQVLADVPATQEVLGLGPMMPFRCC